MRRLLAAPAVVCLFACSAHPDTPAEAARAAHEDAEMSSARPIINVQDLQASLAYYRDRLGFDVDWEYGEPGSREMHASDIDGNMIRFGTGIEQ